MHIAAQRANYRGTDVEDGLDVARASRTDVRRRGGRSARRRHQDNGHQSRHGADDEAEPDDDPDDEKVKKQVAEIMSKHQGWL